MKSDKLVQTGQSFRVKGDAPIAPPADEVVGVEDVTVGDGAAAQKGDDVSMSYVGTLEADGSRFDAGKDFRFTLGAGDVIKGWDRNIPRMSLGERATLTCSSDMAYGQRGASGIPPGATLVFEIELLRITGKPYF